MTGNQILRCEEKRNTYSVRSWKKKKMPKKKRNVLSRKAKIEIIKRIEKWESQASLVKQFDVGSSIVSDS